MNSPYHYLETEQLGTAAVPRHWIWEGYLARGMITLFTGHAKSGKSTLLSLLLAQRKAGGTLAERAVAPGRSTVVTEEPNAFWDERRIRLGFGPRDKFFDRPFKGIPTPQEWGEFIDFQVEFSRAEGVDLVIFDTLSYFLPGRDENNAKPLLESLLPLRKFTQAGLALLLMHHASKKSGQQGTASRGSTMLTSFVDVLVEMYALKPDDAADRRRRLLGFSRERSTPRSLGIELNADGNAYACVDIAAHEDDFGPNWDVLRMVLEDAAAELTRDEILAQWPADFPKPKKSTVAAWTKRATELGLAACAGTGRRADPYRYYLPEKMTQWQADPLFELTRKMQAGAKDVMAALGRRG